MEKALERIELKVWHYKDGKRVGGVHSGISGDVSNIRGDVTGIIGDVTGISGNVTGIRGDVTGISGNVDDCNVTDAEREKGIKIEDLIK